jgi:hypothetical protein
MKFVLPANLAEALTRLETEQLSALTSAVMTENKRRRDSSSSTSADYAKVKPSSVPPRKYPQLPSAKTNLVRAAFSAGMKPAAIARSMGVPISLVNGVLKAPD